MSVPDSARLLREARTRAGLTQTELAARAGVTQSVVSVYESGRRQPALSTLASLVAATGLVLDVQVRTPPTGLRKLVGPVGRRVRRRRADLVAAAATHGITGLRLFGSVARGEDRPDSDVDLVGDIPEDMGLVGLARAADHLGRIVGAKVDLVPSGSFKPAVAAQVAAETVAL